MGERQLHVKIGRGGTYSRVEGALGSASFSRSPSLLPSLSPKLLKQAITFFN